MVKKKIIKPARLPFGKFPTTSSPFADSKEPLPFEIFADALELVTDTMEDKNLFSISDILLILDSWHCVAHKIGDIIGETPPMKINEALKKFTEPSYLSKLNFTKEETEHFFTLFFLLSLIAKQNNNLYAKMVLFVMDLDSIPADFDKKSFDEKKDLVFPEEFIKDSVMSKPANITQRKHREIYWSLEKRVKYMKEQARDIIYYLQNDDISEADEISHIEDIFNNIALLEHLAKKFEYCMGERHVIYLSTLVGITENLCRLHFEIMYKKSAKTGLARRAFLKRKHKENYGSDLVREKNFCTIQKTLNETYKNNPHFTSFTQICEHAMEKYPDVFISPGEIKAPYAVSTITFNCENPRKRRRKIKRS